MRLTVSPYDLTHRAPGALAALLLADAAATIVPLARPWTAGDPETAAEESPSFARLLETWRWTAPLWRAGILGPTDAVGHMGASLVEAAARAIADATALPALARVAGGSAAIPDRARFVETLCMDIVRGGRNPALSVPVAAALERFAADAGWPLVLCPTGSVVGGIEQKLATPFIGINLPAPVAAGGEIILILRDRLASELDSVRSALAEALTAARTGAPADDLAHIERTALDPAGTALCSAAAEFAPGRSRGRSADWTMIRCTIAALPPSAMVRAAEIAAAQLVGTPAAGHAQTARIDTRAIERPSALAVVVRHLPWDLTADDSAR